MSEPFENMRTSGHPNSLGGTIEVVAYVLAALVHPSGRWTLPKFFGAASPEMLLDQNARALRLVQCDLSDNDDWIDLNNSIAFLVKRAEKDHELRKWPFQRHKCLSGEACKSVARRAAKALTRLEAF